MVINYTQTLKTALKQIGYLGVYHQLDLDILLTHLDKYFDWANETKFDWHEIQHPMEFLVEARSNAGRYGRPPITYNLYVGKRGIVLSVKQSGSGFNPRAVNRKRIGRGKWGFKYFRECKETIFFDNSKNEIEVFGLYLISSDRVKA